MATTYDKASLVMIPSGYKDDKLYAVKPTDGSGDFTFSRDGAGASPATRVNASGLIEKGRENLTTFSNDLNNWQKVDITATSGQSGYDGLTDAWLIDITTIGGYVRRDVSYTGVGTFSIYAKAGTADGIRIRLNASSDQNFYYNLTTGSVINDFANIGSKVESLSGGWYRLSVTANLSTLTNFRVYVVDGTTGANTSGSILIQDAQLEQGLISTSYIATTTAPVSAGLLGDMPRLDYSGGASCPSLLLEPSRVNLFIASEYFNSSDWVKTQSTITDNAILSPEGVVNGAKLVENTATSAHHINVPSRGISSGTNYAMSIYAKQGERKYIRLLYDDGTNAANAVFNLETGAVQSEYQTTAQIEDAGDGWYRCIITTPSGGTTTYLQVLLLNDSLQTSYTGDGTSGAYIYAAQFEEGSYSTSYIPTYGSASTRAEEGGQVTSVSDLVGQTEGTLYAEVDSFGVGEVANRILGVSDGSAAERVIMLTRSNGFRFIVTNVSVNSVDYTNYTTTDGVHKLALTYTANEVRIFVDGVKITTESSVTLPSSLNSVHIGKAEINHYYGNNFGGSAKQALVFKTALTDAECIALTTI